VFESVGADVAAEGVVAGVVTDDVELVLAFGVVVGVGLVLSVVVAGVTFDKLVLGSVVELFCLLKLRT